MAAMKAKHAFGKSSSIESAKQANKIDAFDILFLDGDTEKPKVGWLDSQGNAVIIDPYAEVAKLETQVETELATKATAEEVDAKVETAVTEKVESAVKAEVEAAVETAVEAAVEAKVETAVEAAVKEEVETAVKAEVEAAVEKTAEKTKYEITDVPVGTLVDYKDSEIRICCPENTVFTKQNVGAGGDSNTYYVTFKTYIYDDNVVGYKEHLNDSVDAEILTDLKVDEYGRRYQPTWLGVAKYDETTETWTYYGANSTSNKMIGWDYQLDLFNADGVMIASDSVRINLSNENCHFEIEPYYVGKVMTEVETLVDEKIKEIEAGNEIIEF